MAVVELIYDVKPYSYITSNPTKILSNGEPIYLSDGRYGFGDGITTLSSLPLYGGSGYAFTGLTSQYTRGDGTYATFPTNVSSFTNDSGYITSSALSPYLTIANAATTYQPLDADLTSWAGVTRASGFDTFVTTPSSANLLALMTDKTGTGLTVFGTSPTFTTSIITPLVTGVSGTLGFSNAAQSSGAITDFTFTNSTNTGQTASTNIPNFKVTGSTKTWLAGTITNQYWNYFTANTAAFASASTITNSYGLFVEAATAGTNATITNNYAAGFSGATTATGFINSEVGYKIIGAVALDYSSTTLQLGTSSFWKFLALKTNGIPRLTLSTTDLTFSDSYNLIFNDTTGTKIGTATTQKIGFWNAKPIVQPTTAVAAATFVANTSGIANDTATFDGYTIGQVVKALRDAGLLA